MSQRTLQHKYSKVRAGLQVVATVVFVPKLVGDFQEMYGGSFHPVCGWRDQATPTPAVINPLAMPDQVL